MEAYIVALRIGEGSDILGASKGFGVGLEESCLKIQFRNDEMTISRGFPSMELLSLEGPREREDLTGIPCLEESGGVPTVGFGKEVGW